MKVPPINAAPGPEYGDLVRRWQGIPGIARAENGRLWALWYSGGAGEGNDNYVLLVTSDDDGFTWSAPKLVIDPPGMVRTYDSCCWIDPLGRLWLFWAQSYTWFDGRCGVWAIHTENPDAESPQWSAPRRLCDGIMMNKPVVLSTGEWLLPAAVWNRQPKRPEFDAMRFSNIIVSTDQGENWQLRGSADVPERTYDEHQIVELQDGRLWMLVRTAYGIGESFSSDHGETWSPGQPSKIAGPGSRFFIRRLQSGRLLLINHFDFDGRNNLTASLSEDDGKSWPFHLLLDKRMNVSYPDAVESPEGRIYAIYDRERYIDREILMAVFSEADILNGTVTGDTCHLQILINQAKGERVILKK
ncbi:exo-alpha-sialidase [bacterium]|nr:exo-alpha-sialidase [bacterium]